MPNNDRTGQCKTRTDGVHHAGPMAELGLFGRVAAAEDERDGGRREADDGARDGTKEDAVADGGALG